MTPPLEGALVMRRRSSWEAVDSGILLWRDGVVYLILFFALPVWTAAFGLRLLPEPFRPWSYLILWWLKPFFDRFVLHLNSVRFFEQQAGIRRLLQGLGGHLFRGLAGDLLWRRFSPWRSARMPLRLLEKLRGKRFRQRRELLNRGGLGFCLLITVLGLGLEAVLLAGELGFAWIMVDIFRPDLLPVFFDYVRDLEIFLFVIYCFNYMLIESLYVCMGFGLYINSRVEVEGWDIQLLFERFTAKKPGAPAAKPVLLALALVLCVSPAGRAEPVEPPEAASGTVELPEMAAPPGAEEEAEEAPEVKVLIPGPRQPLRPYGDAPSSPGGGLLAREGGREPPLEALEEILSSPDFGGERDGWGIRFKERSGGGEGGYFSFPRMGNFKQAAAWALRLLLICALVLGLGFLLYRFSKSFRSRMPPPPGMAGGRGLFAPDMDPRALLEEAGEFYRQGLVREAWAACLAGTLGAYTRRMGLSFPREATEYDCLALVRAAEGPVGGTRAAAFEGLIQTWVRLAYAGRVPGEGRFEGALNFGRSLLAPLPGEEGARG